MTDATIERPDTEKELAYLKDFQRLSVDTVFRRMYLDARPTRRFLVADEVGLGKTLVARGVIARTIDHLWDTVKRIDIVYLCSNSDIARQNVRRLTPTGISGASVASRITLLPLETHDFKSRKVNVIALTPGTSLNLKGNLGLKRERALLLHILAPHWKLDRTGASRLFAGNASLQRFKAFVRNFEEYEDVDPDLRQSFIDALDAHCVDASRNGEKDIRQRLESLVADFKSESRPSRELTLARTAMVGELRQILARSCIRALQPDLIVLDEFQRFKELLDGEGPAGEMAKHLFEYKDSSTETRVLLLSATPYKMYTVQDDAGNEDHYADFLRTARFLFADDAGASVRLGALLQQFREQLFRLGQEGANDLTVIRDGIEASLRSVMVRTERLAVTPDRGGMLVEKDVGKISIQPRDASNYAWVQTLARLVDSPDTMEYWKSAPWLLNFMEQYKLRNDIDELIEEPRQSREFVRAMSPGPVSLMSFEDVASFKRLDPAHARLRWLIEHALDGGLWKLLWLPPTLPYYQLGTPFADVAVQSPTKTLLFSAWRVVPRVVAAILSHEAERRMYVASEGETADLTGAPDRLGDLLKIARKERRAAGLTVLSLMYPCSWLARTCDPIEMAATFANASGQIPTLDELVEEAERRIGPSLERITPVAPDRSTPDESWYWAAPILLDRANGSVSPEWFDRELAALWAATEIPVSAVPADELDEEDDSLSAGQDAGDSDSAAINDLVERVRQTAKGELPRGVPPKDLLRTLALAAVANPATVSLRSFSRVAGDSVLNSMIARDAAARVGASFRTLFNQPDSTASVRATGTDGQDYWKQCLEYCARGCLQSVLDEYVHLLVGEAGVFGKSPDEIVTAVAGYVSDVVGLRRARVGAQNIVVTNGKVTTKSAAFRSRFAMRFGEERADEAGDKVRADEVRKAFNSPFWPFVLATTSVGQEGLDFHQYCHRVVHWNLPPNPVDLEQREGRVHRFKGHAVRKNVAQRHANVWYGIQSGDRWEETFAEAKRGRLADENDLVPYWVYTAPNGATIERYVPCYPLSRDIERFKSLKDSLVLYRMVFGQPRQEELLSYLARVVPPERIPLLAEQLKISLAPRANGPRANATI
jgi:hypothetical protein